MYMPPNEDFTEATQETFYEEFTDTLFSVKMNNGTEIILLGNINVRRGSIKNDKMVVRFGEMVNENKLTEFCTQQELRILDTMNVKIFTSIYRDYISSNRIVVLNGSMPE